MKPRGRCVACGIERTLTIDGSVPTHRMYGKRENPQCSGAFALPLPVSYG